MSCPGEKPSTSNTDLNQVESENIAKEKALLQNLYVIWNNVGVDEEQKVNRAHQVWGYIFDLLNEILNEENSLYEDIKERIKNYEKKISELNIELQMPKLEEITGTLIVKEETLRQMLDELSKKKHKRLREYHELTSQESKYCEILGMQPLLLSSKTGVPTEKDIYELQQHVKMLHEEKENRQKKLCRLKKELTTILEITELTPETPFEKEILSQNEDTLSLSTETFKKLEQIVTKTKSKRANLETEKADLLEKLTVLWNVMKIDEKEREKFLAEHTDCRVSNLNAIKEEISKYEEIKRQNIAKYVQSMKEELSSLWKKCFVVHSDNMFPCAVDDEMNQSLLDAYDNEISKWRKYYKDTEHIIQQIKERNELWDQMIIFENKAADPNRFRNRRGNLLQEEKQRKELQKRLPKLEEKILISIQNYEKEKNKPFLYLGEKFEDFMKKQWEDRLNQKENEKLTRQKMRSNQLVNEHSLGTTVSKRLLTSMTPKSAPSKLYKPSHGLPIYRNFTTLRQVPNTIARFKNNKMNSSSKRNVKKTLGERNENIPDASECLDSTTYTQFAEKLDRSSRITHRSSVLAAKKIVGTRMSTSNGKRKSANNSIKKSKKKVDSSKLTPAGGKLGLPFLI